MNSSSRLTPEQTALTFELLFQGKWKLPILSVMCSGPVRLGQLARLIPGASKKMLTQNLRKLEADGIVVRTDFSDVVLHVEYDLSPNFRDSVFHLLDQLGEWGEQYLRWSTTNAKAETRRVEAADVSVTMLRSSIKSADHIELKDGADRLAVSGVDEEAILAKFKQMRSTKRTSTR